MQKFLRSIIILNLILPLTISNAKSQGVDSSQIGKEYPFVLPALGGKAYKKGYKLPLPIGVMVNYIYNKQNIVLENFEMYVQSPSESAPDEDDYIDLSSIIQFGPSSVKVNTFNFRADAWLLPFLSVGGYYGKYRGLTNVALTSPITVNSTTENEGAYWGFNLLVVAPIGPINLAADYSWSWSQNNLLNKPVLVNVAGIRAIKNFPLKKEDMFIGVWGGVQFQFLDAKTDGKIPLADVFEGDEFQSDLDVWYNDLTDTQKDLYGDKLYSGLSDIPNSTIHYKFDKRLERNWNFIIGGQWQINRKWQFRTEVGFIKNKSQAMVSMNYRFGIRKPGIGKN